jgi:putative DNA primase/helicase
MTDVPKWQALGFPSEKDWLLSGYDIKPGTPAKSRPFDTNGATPAKSAEIVDLALARDPLIPRDNPDWMDELHRTERSIRADEYNAAIMLAQAPEFSGKIAWDKRKQCPVSLSTTPAGVPGAWTDTHTASAVLWAQRRGIPLKPKMLELAISSLASRNPIDPLQNYLHELAWDGIERLGTWLTTYCGAEESEINSLIGSKFLIGAVARACRPGCRMDYMLVLEGDQGIKKSTAIKILGGDYTAENLPDMHGKDALQAAGSAWFIEIGELAALRRSDIEQVKSFLTRTADTFRRPYDRHQVTVKRWSVLVGNVNPSGNPYLVDTTGNRRFWPVKVTSIDAEALRRDRDQLWAEACHCFNRGDPWWIENDDQRLMLATAQEEREQVDDWQEIIGSWTGSQIRLGSWTGAEVAIGALRLEEKEITVAVQMRIAICMKRLGFVKTRKMMEGVKKWRFEKPE